MGVLLTSSFCDTGLYSYRLDLLVTLTILNSYCMYSDTRAEKLACLDAWYEGTIYNFELAREDPGVLQPLFSSIVFLEELIINYWILI